MKKIVQVAVLAPVPKPLSYIVPEHLQDHVHVGQRVIVPLGRRKASGIIISTAGEPAGVELKEIIDLIDDAPLLPRGLVSIILWAAEYYFAPPSEVIECAVPFALGSDKTRRTPAKADGRLTYDDRNWRIRYVKEDGRPLGIKQKAILKRLKDAVDLPIHELKKAGLYSPSALKRLEARGIVELRYTTGPPEASRYAPFYDSGKPHRLFPDQKTAMNRIAEAMEKAESKTFLLHGVTGSGKTEIYLQATEKVIRLGRTAIILVPEISMTPQLIGRFEARFGKKIAVLHSAMTRGERRRNWWLIRNGNFRIVLGARSAVFAPLEKIGLIVVDEEHDTSYKQEDRVRYNARDVALVRAKMEGAVAILGSATPALETFSNSRNKKYSYLCLPSRIADRPMPDVMVVDMKKEATSGGSGRNISRPLEEALKKTLCKGEQAILFINRRGFANVLLCPHCGHVPRCPACSVSLTFHVSPERLVCHYCNFSAPPPRFCPSCGAVPLITLGAGTQKIIQELERLFPESRIIRMDRDVTRKRGAHEKILARFARREIDILVGTQMVTKGHDYPGVTLVGILAADLSLQLPDFRAAERTFQILCQVAGRAGRGESRGLVVVQTYNPIHYSIKSAMENDYLHFFTEEIKRRRAAGYPPFMNMAALRWIGPQRDEVEKAARRGGGTIQRMARVYKKEIMTLGPAPMPVEKLRGRYRWHLLIKAEKKRKLHDFVKEVLEAVPSRSFSGRVNLQIDIDPQSFI